MKKSKTCAQRLSELGLNNDTFRKYCEMFVNNKYPFSYAQKQADNWFRLRYPWNSNKIARHLTQEDTIGLIPDVSIDYIMFDIDNHGEQEISTKERARIIMELFPLKPLVYQSSDSGGLRIVYFLSQYCPREYVDRLASEKLEQADLNKRSGFVEVMANKHADRLPFGKDSYLLDMKTLEPLTNLSLKETILKGYKVFLAEKVQVTDVDYEPWNDPAKPDESIAERLHIHGLYRDVTTNDAFMRLLRRYANRDKMTANEARAALRYWIDNKHNGCSDRVNAGKLDDIYEQIDRLIKSYKFPGSSYKRRPLKGLPGSVCKAVIAAFDNLREQYAAFSMFQYTLVNFEDDLGYCTEELFKEMIKTIKNNNEIEEYKRKNIRKIKEVRRKKEEIISKNNLAPLKLYLCSIPWKAERNMDGYYKKNVAVTRRMFDKYGFLTLERNYYNPSSNPNQDAISNSNGKCRRYYVLIPVDPKDDSEFSSLDDFIESHKEDTGSEGGQSC